jgi:hypothetical protein
VKDKILWFIGFVMVLFVLMISSGCGGSSSSGTGTTSGNVSGSAD